MRAIHIFSAIPASGKTTYINNVINCRSLALHRDDFRAQLRRFFNSESYFPCSSAAEWRLWTAHISHALITNPDADFYIDQTTIGIDSFVKLYWSLPLRPHIDYIVLHIFDIPYAECLRRNAERSGNARVPDSVMEQMYSRFSREPITRELILSKEIPFTSSDLIMRHYLDEGPTIE